MKSYDVVVVGVGGMGAATVYRLAKQGLNVMGLDRFTPVHDRGSSHGESRMIRQAYFESPDYVPLILRTYELWRELERDARATLLCETGGLMIGRPDSELVSGSLNSARTHGLPYEMLNADETRKRFPLFKLPEDMGALFEPKAGVLFVERCVQTMIGQAKTLGADLRFEERVLDWSVSKNGIEVTTERGRYRAGELVLTPGAWSEPLLKRHIPLSVKRLVMHWFKPISGRETRFNRNGFPVHIWDLPDGKLFYGMPKMGRGEEGVKAAFHNVRQHCDPERVRREVGDSEILEITDYIKRYLPSLNGGHFRAKVCLYTMTPDDHFVLGRHPDFDKVFIACGFSGHGFKFTPVVGEILADLITEGKTSHPIKIFDPRRFGP